jgi:hypothetical protein
MLRGAVASNLLVEPSCFREEFDFTNNRKMKRTTLLNDPVICSRDHFSTPFSIGYFSGKSIPFGCHLQIVQIFQEKADKSTAQHSKKTFQAKSASFHAVRPSWPDDQGRFYSSGCQLIGTSFDLKQFHFHTPSEHTVDGDYFPLEMHLVHEATGTVRILF